MATILGISAFYHDSAAALVRDGQVVAAAQEERFTRRKNDAEYPENAVAYCLAEAEIDLGDLDRVVFYEKPLLKFERIVETYLALAPRGLRSFLAAMPLWLGGKLRQKDLLAGKLGRGDILFAEHHMSHAASAFYPSPFDEAAILTMDGVGEWTTTSFGWGRGSRIEIVKELHFPHSLGMLYSAFTQYLGFHVNGGEYKVMGLAAHGSPRYRDLILDNLLDAKADGSFRLNLDYFDYCTGLTMTSRRFHSLFGGPPRRTGDPLEQRHKDIAASAQSVLEDLVLRVARSIARETRMENLCMAGGVALNCVANGRLLREGPFRRLWIQPAAGDAGGALGAALLVHHQGNERTLAPRDGMRGALLGPGFSQPDIELRLSALGVRFRTLAEADLLATTVEALASQKVVGWFQGRMEFGPRALGNRSILADPRSASMREVLNDRVKRREWFRPFGPAVMAEHAADWFHLAAESPYMLLVAQARSDGLPAATNIDGSARVQTVDRESNPRFHALLSAFFERTGCPALVNTSFNVRDEPIVCTPEDAHRCFVASGCDLLVVGDCLVD